MNDALTATAAGGSMQLTQNATGGAGGQSFGGVGGLGGFGTSSLTFSTIGDATQPDVLRGNVTGAGGAGGSGFSGGASSNGGEGDAYIYLTGVNNVSATATADGGQGGNGAVGGKAEANSTAISTTGTATATAYAGGGNATGGIQGDAVAAALAETSNGQQAQAIASVDGDASVQATASSSWTTGYVTAVSSTIAQTGSGELTLSSIVNSGNGATPLNDLGATNNAIASALPSTLAVNDLLANDPALNGLIGSVDTTATGLISGDESGVAQTGASGPQVIVSTDDFTLDTAGLSGNFIMGLIGSESYGSGFTNLDMQVSFDGASALHQDFTSVAAAKAYFNDQAVNFGSVGALPGGPLQVSVTLTVTSNAPDSGFGDAFLFATTGVNGPPVVATGPAPIIGANIQTAIPGISVSEAGNLTGVNFSVTLSDNTGQLAVNGGAIAVTGDNSNKVSFSGTLAQVNAILATLTDDNSVAGPDGIDVKVSDGANVTQTVDPVTVNSAPVWAAPAIAGYADVGTEAVKSVSLSEIGDVAPGETFTVTVSANHGQPTLGGAGVQSFDAVAITGDEAQVNAALANLTLDENSPGTDTLTLKAKDSFGNSTSEQIGVYAAGPLTLTTPPSVTLPSGGAGSTPISGASLSQTGASPTETFSVTLSDVYGDLTASATGGASVANNGSTDIVVSGALAQVNAALSSLTDNDPSGKADTIQVKATDSYGDSAGVNNIAVGVSQIYSAAQIEALTPTQIATLGTEGVTSISSSGVIRLTVPQADAFIMAAIQILPSGGMEVQVVDSGAQIETLTPTQIAGLPGLSPEFYAVISSNSGSVTLSLAQALALADGSMEVAVPFGSTLSLSDNVSDIQALKPAQIDALIGSYNGWSAIDATSGPVTIDAQQAVALEGYNAALNYYAPLSIQNATVTIADKAANIEQMTPTEISRLTQSGMSIGGLVSTDASLVFSVAQVEAIGSAFYVTVPATDTVTISDSAADIEALLNTSFVPVELAEQFAHISGIAADDASIVLTAAEAENLIQANVNLGMTVALSAPAGDSVTVQDSSADIEALTPTQLGDLSSIGVSAIHVTDLAVTLTVAQALALLDPVSIAVEPGGSVIVAGSESDIENLTPQQAAELSGLGVNEYDFQSLSGAEPLTIAVGQTLTVDGAVASGQSITFAGGDGKLALADAADMQGTVSGFQPTDAIDLTGAPYDASATATLEANNVLQVVENSGTYDIQLDPGQYFFTDNNLDTFNVAADANGQTEITLQQTPINYFEEVIPSGENADGVAVASGGVLEVQSGATLNGATVASGGDVLADNGGVANGVTLDGGELDNYGSAAGTVVGAGGLLQAYAPTTATTMQAGGTADIWGSDGGTLDVTAATGGAAVFQDAYGALQLDGTTIPDVTVDAFQPGDVIDLAGATYDSSAKPTLLAGNVLQIQELSGTYDVRLQPSQYFLSESFVVGPDNAAGTDITLQPTTLTTYAAIPTGDDVYGVTVGSGGEVDVQSQSTLAQAQVGGGGQILVESGGKDTDSILNAGSAETVLYGGEADGTGIDGGAQTIANGGYAGLVFVGNGGEQIVRGGGSVNVTEINDGGLVDYQAGSKINGYVNFLTTTGTAEFDGANIPGVGIYNFAAGDKIDLANYSGETGYTFTGGDLKVDFAGNESLTLNLENANPADTFQFSPFGGTGTQIELAAPCFCKGTLIRAERGEVAVETLKRGDLVMTTEGVAKPVSWIGRRAVRSAFADPVRSWPIRVRAGALGENVPSRDLLLSPDHALLVGDVLIQAGALVNGTSIVRETSVPPVFVYYHVEIDDHSLILAENTAAETFVDNLDRPGFDNWAEHEALYPDGNPIEEMSYPRAKARRQVPMHIRAALDARANAICGKKALAMA